MTFFPNRSRALKQAPMPHRAGGSDDCSLQASFSGRQSNTSLSQNQLDSDSGYHVAEDGSILSLDGKPVCGPGGQILSLSTNGRSLVGADGQPALGSDGMPLLHGKVKIKKKPLDQLSAHTMVTDESLLLRMAGQGGLRKSQGQGPHGRNQVCVKCWTLGPSSLCCPAAV
jgi:hypothetical protein